MPIQRQPVIEELASAGARLLRTEQVPDPSEPERWRAVVLTFDQGRLIVSPSERGDELALRVDAGEEPLPPETVESDEEEPWWRVLGNPLHGAWARSDPERAQVALELQFRPDHAQPRYIALELQGGALRVQLLNVLVG